MPEYLRLYSKLRAEIESYNGNSESNTRLRLRQNEREVLEDGVQPPLKCVMPSDVKKSQARRLGESVLTREDAELACSHVSEQYKTSCIFDVLVTNDLDVAGSYST